MCNDLAIEVFTLIRGCIEKEKSHKSTIIKSKFKVDFYFEPSLSNAPESMRE